MRKQYLEKEEQGQRMEFEVKILECKLEANDKHLIFQDSINILDIILSSQRSPSIKSGPGFHEIVKGESSSQACASNYEVNKEKSESPSKPNQQPKKKKFKGKHFLLTIEV